MIYLEELNISIIIKLLTVYSIFKILNLSKNFIVHINEIK